MIRILLAMAVAALLVAHWLLWTTLLLTVGWAIGLGWAIAHWRYNKRCHRCNARHNIASNSAPWDGVAICYSCQRAIVQWYVGSRR